MCEWVKKMPGVQKSSLGVELFSNVRQKAWGETLLVPLIWSVTIGKLFSFLEPYLDFPL